MALEPASTRSLVVFFLIGGVILIILLSTFLYKVISYWRKWTMEKAQPEVTDLEKEYNEFKKFEEIEQKAIKRQAEILSSGKAF